MRAVIVHESLFGNTRMLAETIATTLRDRYEVTVTRAADATPESITGADLVVLGAPTHAHGLSQPGTRRGTVQQGVPIEIATAPGMRDFLASLHDAGGVVVAAFDTRLRGPAWLYGSAARRIATRVRRLGFTLLVPPESFLVSGTRGPLMDGELDRASRWAAVLADRASTPAARAEVR